MSALSELINISNTITTIINLSDLIKKYNIQLDNNELDNCSYDNIDDANLVINKLLEFYHNDVETTINIQLLKLNCRLDNLKTKIWLKNKIVKLENKKKSLNKCLKHFNKRIDKQLNLIKTEGIFSNELLQVYREELILRNATIDYYNKKILFCDELLEIITKRLEIVQKITLLQKTEF